MGVKEVLKKRIIVKDSAKSVLMSILRSKGGIKKIDKDSMRELLSLSRFEKKIERDLELYEGYGNVLVLDNELPVYTTDVNDVVIRKSPVLKEMVKIRNIIKILWDSSVVRYKGAETVNFVKDLCLDELKIKINDEDISELKYDGAASLESYDFEETVEILTLFFELLSFDKLLKPYSVNKIDTWAKTANNNKGPFVICNHETEMIWFYNKIIENDDKESVAELMNVAKGFRQSFPHGREVFEMLEELSKKII